MHRRSFIASIIAALACLKLPPLFAAAETELAIAEAWVPYVPGPRPFATLTMHPLFAGTRVGRWRDLMIMYERADGSYAEGVQWPDNVRFGVDPPAVPLELNRIRAAI